MMQNQEYDQQVANIINKVLSKKRIPISISNNPENIYIANIQDSIPVQRHFPSNLFSVIPDSSVQNYQLQIQNKQLRDTQTKLTEKLKKIELKKSKHHLKVKEIQRLQSQLNTIIQSNRSLETELNSCRLSRHQISNAIDLVQYKNLNNQTRKFNRNNKPIYLNKKQSQSCCQKVRKYKQIIKALRKSPEKKQFLTDSNKTNAFKDPKSSDKSSIYIDGQCNLMQSFQIQASKAPLYADFVIQVQQSYLEISQAEQYKASISEQIENQKQYIKSLQNIILQQQKVLKDYEKQIEETTKKNKSKDVGKFVKNKSKSELKTSKKTCKQTSGGKLQKIQSLARLNAVTDRLQSCPSTGIILRKGKTGK